MVACCVPDCKNRSDRKKEDGITFHKFPRDAVKANEWLEAIGKPFWAPKDSSRVCSIHFLPTQLNKTYASGVVKVRDDAIPSLEIPVFDKKSKGSLIVQTGYLVFTGKRSRKEKISLAKNRLAAKRRGRMPRKRKPSLQENPDDTPKEILSSVGLLPKSQQNKENLIPQSENDGEDKIITDETKSENTKTVQKLIEVESSGESSCKENITDEEAGGNSKGSSTKGVKKRRRKAVEDHQKSILLTKRKPKPSQKLLLSQETYLKKKAAVRKSPVKRKRAGKGATEASGPGENDGGTPEKPLKENNQLTDAEKEKCDMSPVASVLSGNSPTTKCQSPKVTKKNVLKQKAVTRKPPGRRKMLKETSEIKKEISDNEDEDTPPSKKPAEEGVQSNVNGDKEKDSCVATLLVLGDGSSSNGVTPKVKSENDSKKKTLGRRIKILKETSDTEEESDSEDEEEVDDPSEEEACDENNQSAVDQSGEKRADSYTPCVVLSQSGPSPVTWVMVQEGPGPDGTLPPPKLTPTVTRLPPFTKPAHQPKVVPKTGENSTASKTNENKTSKTSENKVTNFRAYPNETIAEMNMRYKVLSLTERIRKKSKEIKVLNQQNKRLKNRLLKEKSTVKRQKELLAEAEKERLNWKEMSDLGKLIFKLHMEDYPHSCFPTEVKNFTLNLYGISPKAYKFVRSCFKGLPHPRTIHKWFSKDKWPKIIDSDNNNKVNGGVEAIFEIAEGHDDHEAGDKSIEDCDTGNYVIIDKDLIPEGATYELTVEGDNEIAVRKENARIVTIEGDIVESTDDLVDNDDLSDTGGIGNCDVSNDSSQVEDETILECVLDDSDDGFYPAEMETASIEVVISE